LDVNNVSGNDRQLIAKQTIKGEQDGTFLSPLPVTVISASPILMNSINRLMLYRFE